MKWRHLAVPGKRDLATKHEHLIASERIVLEAVQTGPWVLEQERIPVIDAVRALLAAVASDSQESC
jgi:hypothetical protein